MHDSLRGVYEVLKCLERLLFLVGQQHYFKFLLWIVSEN